MTTYIVLGMGRSGTSFLTNCLERSGVRMGRGWFDSANPSGGFENQDFAQIDRDIISDAGGGWGLGAIPPPEADLVKAGEAHKDSIRAAIRKHRSARWGFKNPRSSFLMPIYMPLIEEVDDDPFIYACFRKPRYVNESMQRLDRRAKRPKVGEYVETAKEYNRRLLRWLWDYLELDT